MLSLLNEKTKKEVKKKLCADVDNWDLIQAGYETIAN